MKKWYFCLIGALLLIAGVAMSTPMLETDFTGIIGITGLEIDGITYDVDWVGGSFNEVFSGGVDPTFWGDDAVALLAVSSIADFLNESSVSLSDMGGGLQGLPDTGQTASLQVPVRLEDVWAFSAGEEVLSDFVSWNELYFPPQNQWVVPDGWERISDMDEADIGDAYVTFSPHSPVPGPVPAPVPEPATILLLGTGLAGLIGLGRKKLKK